MIGTVTTMPSWRERGASLAKALGQFGVSVLRTSAKGTGKIAQASGRAVSKLGKKAANARKKAAATRTPHSSTSATTLPAPKKSKVTRRPKGNHATTYSVERNGLPDFAYAPDRNGHADPGEVIWTWVPYSDDPSIGKDRPALVLAERGHSLIVAQLTSKNHDLDRQQEAAEGRYWFKVGSGDWDRKHRTSFMRVDRLIQIQPDAMRREGGRLPEDVFTRAVKELKRFHTH